MKLSKKTIVVWVIILLALIMVVATVSAADISAVNEIAAADIHGAEGLFNGSISATDQQLISPWAIDPGKSAFIF